MKTDSTIKQLAWVRGRRILGWCCMQCVMAAAIAQPVINGLRENLGIAVNNSADQIIPLLGSNGMQLFFSQNDNTSGYYEIWQAQAHETGSWAPAGKTIRLRSPEMFNQFVFGAFANEWFLINGRFPVVNGSRRYEKGFSWYKAESDNFDPAKAIALEIEGIDASLKGVFANIFFHPKKKVLLLSYANPEKRDLFICKPVDSTQWPIVKWQKPVLLPSDINTSFEESCPFLDASGRMLFFSSNRPGGYGSDDIYVSYALTEDLLQWSRPVNMGHRVNSNFSELYFTTYANHPYAYFVSYKHSLGAGDIFRIQMVDSVPLPLPITQAPVPPAPTATVATGKPASTTPTPPAEKQIKPGQLPIEAYKPNNLTLLLDKSVSMSQNNRIDLLRQSAAIMLGKLRYLDKVSLITFGEKAQLAYATSSLNSADTLLQLIDRLQPDEGETFVNNGIQKAMEQTTNFFIDSGNNEILVITDGYFSIADKTLQLLQANSRVKLTFVLVDAGTIEANIKNYISKRLPMASILTLTNGMDSRNVLLEHIKFQSAISR